MHKTNEMMSEMEGEYLSLMQKIQEKENSLQQSHVNVLSLQKQVTSYPYTQILYPRIIEITESDDNRSYGIISPQIIEEKSLILK